MGSRLLSLQAGRAAAALAVVAYHAALAASAFVGPLPAWASGAAGYGYLGVDFFFVLSGFIIAYTAGGPRERPTPGAFLARRLIRVFVPYWPVGIGIALLYAALPQLSGAERGWQWVPSLALIPWSGPPALSVAWSLQLELVFYAIFAAGLACRAPYLLLSAWFAAIGVTWVLGPALPSAVGQVLFSLNLEFALGVGAALILPRLGTAGATALGLAGVVVLTLWILGGAGESTRVLVALAMACGLVPVVRAEKAGRLRVPSWLVVLGDASYAVYLVHLPVMSATGRVLGRSGFAEPLIGMAILAAAGVAVGVGYHFQIEKPAMRWAWRLRLRPEGQAAPAPAQT
jgi:peptidoglycan/LPS O-acetylase OafA/YrhL